MYKIKLDLGSSAARRGGSSPFFGTIYHLAVLLLLPLFHHLHPGVFEDGQDSFKLRVLNG